MAIAKEDFYKGQLDPYWKENLNSILDEQQQIMVDAEKQARAKSLPKELAILGGGIVAILFAIIIFKKK